MKPTFCHMHLASLCLLLGGCCAESSYEVQTSNPTVRLPADESAHCYGAEWWYYSGRLVADDENGYGVHAVIFHVPQIAWFGLSDVWMAHYAVLNERDSTFMYSQARVINGAQLNQQDSGFDLRTPLIRISGRSGTDHLQARMPDGRFALDLFLVDSRGPVLHGGEGYVPFGEGDSSFYYSRPRMRAMGSLEIGGQSQSVSGDFWFDRQWGRDLSNPWLGWDWFSLRLDTGADVMVYKFRGSQPQITFGTYTSAAGESYMLSDTDFTITPKSFWTSLRTGATYPVSWEILIVPEQLFLKVTAAAVDQEIDARATTLNVYWEGLCNVVGAQEGKAVTGFAFAELANYTRFGH